MRGKPERRFHTTADLSESGRGLELVNLLATRWGDYGNHNGNHPDHADTGLVPA